jgi:glutamate N-acetyltransferase/amino-acid N-acetyltransferase
LVNAGNANACTGEQGERDAQTMASHTAQALGCLPEEVLICSTGIIGHLLKMEKILPGIEKLAGAVKSHQPLGDFSRAILTTDLVEKTDGIRLEMDGREVRIAGTCKGSGMIAPRMATTLGFVVTDVGMAPALLQAALAEVAGETFNCLTVDGDTSTNDTLLLLASGSSKVPIAKSSSKSFSIFKEGLFRVCDALARKIAADGEGAEHTITLYVGGTANDEQARVIARAIAESPLVKTAMAGRDPNWGRILAAAGRAGVLFDPAQASLSICGFELFRGGLPLPFDPKAVSTALGKREVNIVFLAGDGPGRARFYTCDLTHGYIQINAEYHT